MPGFESNKYLNLKLNQKLLKKNEDPVDLERDCPQDLIKRAED